ncbi:MAG: histidinol-phosphate transaminase [Planctomycetota bacterium]|nr:histidinol-phosphate transaminase [Planctomycetota bacterium]
MSDVIPNLVPAPGVAGTKPYGVPKPAAKIDLRLDGNEGVLPPAGLFDVVRETGMEVARRYPDAGPLTRAIAARLDVAASRVLVTAGADDALDRACRSVLFAGRELIVATPTFEMIPRYVALAGGTLVGVSWQRGALPVGEMLARVTPNTAAIVVVTPNNPNGLVATAEELSALSRGAPNTLLVVDMAYGEFADVDLTRVVLGLPNAVMLRTMSKAWGLAGMRVGFAAGCEQAIGWMRAAGGPYAVSGPSLAVAERWLATGENAMRGFVDRVRRERGELTALLASLGADASASQANFAFARFANAGAPRAQAVYERLAERGIAVRWFSTRAEIADCLRITCPGEEAAFVRLKTALHEVLGPSAKS